MHYLVYLLNFAKCRQKLIFLSQRPVFCHFIGFSSKTKSFGAYLYRISYSQIVLCDHMTTVKISCSSTVSRSSLNCYFSDTICDYTVSSSSTRFALSYVIGISSLGEFMFSPSYSV